MFLHAAFRRRTVTFAAVISLLAPTVTQACTSLLYTDANGAPYAGRTMELSMELPYHVAYVPAGQRFASKVSGNEALNFAVRNGFIGVGVPDPMDGKLKFVQGVNDKGLTFALLAYASSDGPADQIKKTRAVLSAIDLGAWTLSQIATVAEVKAALQRQPVLTTALLPFGLLKTPFHYTLHDATGASIVIEFANGKEQVHDNPVGVMTNGPEFPWHMTNLNNYTFFTNIDQSRLTIAGREFKQPDSGIATVALPASNTSVGRFVRATYYSHFAEKKTTPDAALHTLAHIMNNFDRPRGITIDNRLYDSSAEISAPGVTGEPLYTSEYTSWTTLTDLRRRTLHIRVYDGLNYVRFDVDELVRRSGSVPRTATLKSMAGIIDGTAALLAAK